MSSQKNILIVFVSIGVFGALQANAQYAVPKFFDPDGTREVGPHES